MPAEVALRDVFVGQFLLEKAAAVRPRPAPDGVERMHERVAEWVVRRGPDEVFREQAVERDLVDALVPQRLGQRGKSDAGGVLPQELVNAQT